MVLSRFYILLPLLVAILWQVLDANPSLFLYDLLVPQNRSYYSLQNKTIWVTGASSGIGAEIICELVKAQASHGVLPFQVGLFVLLFLLLYYA